jgi:hypothetical protein
VTDRIHADEAMTMTDSTNGAVPGGSTNGTVPSTGEIVDAYYRHANAGDWACSATTWWATSRSRATSPASTC